MLRRLACSRCWLLALLAGAAQAQTADTILLDGKIVTFDSAPAEALAVRGDRIVAVGRSADIRALAGPATRVIDLAGRTVIPGLIDSHIHAIRAGLTYTTEVHWIGARSLAEALDRLRAAAQTAPKGSWLVVAGGWIETQFAEKRRPTQAEIAAAAPDHHVYVQLLYSAVLLTAGGIEALGIANDAALASRLTIETGADGKPTGWIAADNRTISDLFDRLPRPTLRAAGRRHARLLPHAQQPRHHRRARSRRLQHADRGLRRAVPGVARPRADASASSTACARRAATMSLRISRR